jgi:hypothetical protein
LNPLLRTTHVHTPYLPFQIIKIVRQTAFSVFIAVNQLAPALASPANNANSEEGLQAGMNQLRGVVALTNQGAQRLLELEFAPFRSEEGEKGMDRLKRELGNWLVNNEIRNERGVDAAIKGVVERRNAEAREEE